MGVFEREGVAGKGWVVIFGDTYKEEVKVPVKKLRKNKSEGYKQRWSRKVWREMNGWERKGEDTYEEEVIDLLRETGNKM